MINLEAELHQLSQEEREGIEVLGVAGEWSTVKTLAHLDSDFNSKPIPDASVYKRWRVWIVRWAEKGWIESKLGSYGSVSVRLSYENLDIVLRSMSDGRRDNYLEELRYRSWGSQSVVQISRLALYGANELLFVESMGYSTHTDDWLHLFGQDPAPEVASLIPDVVKEKYLRILSEFALELMVGAPRVVLQTRLPGLAPYQMALLALAGDVEAAQLAGQRASLEVGKTGELAAATVLLKLASNDIEGARSCAAQALALSKGKKKYPSLNGTLSLWSALCALTGSLEQRALGQLLIMSPRRSAMVERSGDCSLLALRGWMESSSETPMHWGRAYPLQYVETAMGLLFQVLLCKWKIVEELCDEDIIDDFAHSLKQSGYHWLCAEVLSLTNSKAKAGTLVQLFQPKAMWQRKLDSLAVFASIAQSGSRKSAPKTKAQQRILWVLDEESAQDVVTLSALLQKQGKKGYSKGRKVQAAELWKKRNETWLGVADRQVIDAIETTKIRGTPIRYRLGEKSLLALVGHEGVVWNDSLSQPPAQVVLESPVLRVLRGKKTITLIAQPWSCTPLVTAVRDKSRLLIQKIDQQHAQLCSVIGAPQLELPLKAQKQLAAIMGQFPKNIALHSDIPVEGVDLVEVPTDSRIVVFLRRNSEQLRINIVVCPFGEDGPECAPGEGNRSLVAEIAGQATKTRRDLVKERAHEKQLLDRCPLLARANISHGEWVVQGLGAILELLHELHGLGDSITCLWKEGEPLQVDLDVDMSALQMHFGDANAWMTADISVAISDSVSLRAHEIVSKMVVGAKRFVQLDDNRFAVLSETLSDKILGLEGLGKTSKKGIVLGPANAYALSAWLGDINLKQAKKGAKLATKRLEKVRESTTLHSEVPKTFAAELRSYQEEAYQWLTRLAHWGGGAMLCDDMGLGKTIQMLAVLTQRAARGPALVVAPVSVASHWANLMHQFAPTLSPIKLGSSGRSEKVKGLGNRDVLIISYGLLHNESELLSSRSFSTIVLDEAQAIKNASSRRAKAAFKLQGEFRVITTGTPIENNLGELWSLMNFANPGLLGSSRQFSDTFGKPIQKEGCRESSARLRKILTPFLLRRTKAEVLTELPAKTEITLEIKPNHDEAAFYAAVREHILAELRAGKSRPAQQRVQILAALMKLRRIACHPSLVDSDLDCSSAKQETFLSLVDELRGAGHRILVFSQFVGHLTIARKNLDDRSISYQYLDGKTSKAKRAKAVEAFQNGEGDAFLISLKAGGVGLHLTGADYVIHLDPWWNPAVEDQASDRAHRMGQTRPVTVYRLVTKGTVEERVLSLHAQKRQLADDLISGSENAGSLDVQDLMELMAEAGAV